MIFFDGKTEAEKLDLKIVKAVPERSKKTLAIVQIGENPASAKYVSLKAAYCEKLGVKCEVAFFDEFQIKQAEEFLTYATDSSDVSSIIVQLPLPEPSFYSLLDLLPLEKDIDLLSSKAKSKFYSGNFAFLSPVIRAIDHFICSNSINYDSLKKVGIIGHGDLVGKPLEKYLSAKCNNVEVITNYESGQQLDYDLVVLSTDVPNLIKGDAISSGCHVIDFGSTIVNGKTTGNLDLTSTLDHLGIISKSPGGMGPLVIRFLVMNHLRI